MDIFNINKLNKIRNKYSHELGFNILDADLEFIMEEDDLTYHKENIVERSRMR